MYCNSKFIILLLIVVFKNGLGQRSEGDDCTILSSGTNGICKLISSCPSAIEVYQKQQIPQRCGYKNNIPIVCCVDGSTSSTTTGAPTTRRQVKEFIIKPIPISSSTIIHQKLNLPVGEKSKQKCQEYGKYVNELAAIAPVLGSDTVPLYQSCVTVNVENIVGGETAKPKEFPHMALIGFEDTDGSSDGSIKWLCGGTLISEKYILSAAHCGTYTDNYGYAKYILLGELILDSSTDDAKPQIIPIKNITLHPNYKTSSRYNDIALFELQSEAKLDSYIRPACLNTNSKITNRVGVATGWGLTSSGGVRSNALMKVTLDIFPTSECNYSYRYNINEKLANGIVEETQLCAGSRNEPMDACEGDSGGPFQVSNGDEVYCTYKILGITSFGKDCGKPNFAGVYTRVSGYIKWIEDIVWP